VQGKAAQGQRTEDAMYVIDGPDAVVELNDVPKPDIGAPLPLLLSDESHLVLAYITAEPDPAWDGSHTTVVSPESDGEPIAVVRFRWPSAHIFGPPNDEAFSGHPLATRGLRPYRVFEVHESSWIRRLERMNSVHPRHDPERFLAGLRHYVFAFHDSTFECIAEGFAFELVRASMRRVIGRMAELLAERQT
jgi:hypothetical protein